MKIEITMELPITAKPIDHFYDDLEFGKHYPVSMIDMGQSHTSVFLEDKKSVYNSVRFKFYIGESEIDIYKSGLINGYRTSHLPGIWYVGGKDGRL
jgi:hypothetical protein